MAIIRMRGEYMQAAPPADREIFGAGGYRAYANALHRHPISCHSSIGKADSRVSALAVCNCGLLRTARDAGHDPQCSLDTARNAILRDHDRLCGIEHVIVQALGDEELDLLFASLCVTKRDLRHAMRSHRARHHPHFRLTASTLLALQQSGPHTAMLVSTISQAAALDATDA
ncbi:hypothetical protein [Paracoccus sp. 1_MG-2023]|uniref:hypothetical protein n=1 Tax=Paracoccus sp. 1_MG-2023 TaxID=3062651 RepID=UPI0026E470FD|nr:hypothetical protein [Paracoccus sp. 1_MG-2023]